MFQFPAFAHLAVRPPSRTAGFPHSEILGSMRVCRSPKLIAAYRVLHRLRVPRHPLRAFIRLTSNPIKQHTRVIRTSQAIALASDHLDYSLVRIRFTSAITTHFCCQTAGPAPPPGGRGLSGTGMREPQVRGGDY